MLSKAKRIALLVLAGAAVMLIAGCGSGGGGSAATPQSQSATVTIQSMQQPSQATGGPVSLTLSVADTAKISTVYGIVSNPSGGTQSVPATLTSQPGVYTMVYQAAPNNTSTSLTYTLTIYVQDTTGTIPAQSTTFTIPGLNTPPPVPHI